MMEAALEDMTRTLGSMDAWQYAFDHAVLEVELEICDGLDDPWFVDDDGVVVTDDAHQFDRSARLSARWLAVAA